MALLSSVGPSIPWRRSPASPAVVEAWGDAPAHPTAPGGDAQRLTPGG
ncbi:MAG: hypothetical protein VKO65_04700 [Cyanobacteriota bacterium]|nr:hypothetical protein [Cyanobacteriota bacterium]